MLLSSLLPGWDLSWGFERPSFFQTWGVGLAHHRLSLCGAESLLSAGWGRLFLVLSCVVRSGVERLRPLALSCVLSSHESILCKVINDHVVEFLRQLQDSTEDIHLLAPDHCSVPTTSDWFESTTIVADLVPLLRV